MSKYRGLALKNIHPVALIMGGMALACVLLIIFGLSVERENRQVQAEKTAKLVQTEDYRPFHVKHTNTRVFVDEYTQCEYLVITSGPHGMAMAPRTDANGFTHMGCSPYNENTRLMLDPITVEGVLTE